MRPGDRLQRLYQRRESKWRDELPRESSGAGNYDGLLLALRRPRLQEPVASYANGMNPTQRPNAAPAIATATFPNLCVSARWNTTVVPVI
jgi:hypothetical protein